MVRGEHANGLRALARKQHCVVQIRHGSGGGGGGIGSRRRHFTSGESAHDQTVDESDDGTVKVCLGDDVSADRLGIGERRAGHHFVSEQIGRAPSELQSLMRISYAVFCLKKKKKINTKIVKKDQQQQMNASTR